MRNLLPALGLGLLTLSLLRPVLLLVPDAPTSTPDSLRGLALGSWISTAVLGDLPLTACGRDA